MNFSPMSSRNTGRFLVPRKELHQMLPKYIRIKGHVVQKEVLKLQSLKCLEMGKLHCQREPVEFGNI